MRRLLLFAFFFLILAFSSTDGMASHIYGGDFFYTYISGTSYKITLAIYGDCTTQATNGSFTKLPTSAPEVRIYNNGVLSSTISLTLEGPGVEVTPVCASEKNNTNCNINGGVIPGVKRFIYSSIVSLAPSPNWMFLFTGGMGNAGAQAGRSNSITNIVGNNSGIVMALQAKLNNQNAPNSSPQFTTLPTPFYCINVPQEYNQGAVDVNNDSLVYALVPGLTIPNNSTNVTSVTYGGGYSATNPIYTSSGIVFDPLTGQLSFTPSAVQRSLVVNGVTEYRNGVIVGTAMREMTFVVLSSCNNTPASGKIDSTATQIGGSGSGTSFTGCVGTPLTSFLITPVTTANDTLNVFLNGLPAGATASIANNNTPNPVITFSWNTTSVAAGNYTFFVTYKDNGCPLSSLQTLAYTVHLIEKPQMATTIVAPTQCAHQAWVQFNFSQGQAPRTIVIQQNGNVVKTFTDLTGQDFDSLAAGTYTVTISSANNGCPATYPLTIPDGGVYPFSPVTSPNFYCTGAAATALNIDPAPNATVHWFDISGNPLSQPPVVNTSVPGIFTYLVSQLYKVCESKKDTFRIYVTDRPTAAFTITPKVLCDNDTATAISLSTIGTGPIIDYNWNWSNASSVKATAFGGPWRVNWRHGGEKVITLQVAENKCFSLPVTDSVHVNTTPAAVFYATGTICVYDSSTVYYDTIATAGQTYRWSFSNAQIATSTDPGPFRLRWPDAGIKHVVLAVTYNNCTDSASRDIMVNPAPKAVILNVPGTICVGDKITLEASGGGTYQWLPQGHTWADVDGSRYTIVTEPSTFTVLVTNEYKCVDSASVTYNQIEPCCNFSYPNAFTPNGDGKNDQFRALMYGNPTSYKFMIYNRWGQRVFITYDPKAAWDGTLGGIPCEIGNYYYILEAKCYTGHEETRKGEVLLIR